MLSEDRPEWNGSPTELAEALQLDMKPNLLTKHLNVNKARLFYEYQIDYEPVRIVTLGRNSIQDNPSSGRVGGSITVGHEAQSADKASECEQSKVIQ